MAGLGYGRYGAQGGDWGSMISTQLGLADPEHVVGVHLNMVVAPPPPDLDFEHLQEDEQVALGDLRVLRARRLGVLEDPGHQAPDHRLRARRLAGRPRRLDRREVPHLERLRRRRRAAVHQGPAARQRDALLAHGHRPLCRAPLLRGRADRAGSWPTAGSRSRWGWPRSPRRSSGRPGAGPRPATTSGAGPKCPGVVTSLRSKSPSCWWPTSGSSSGRSERPCRCSARVHRSPTRLGADRAAPQRRAK